MIQKVEIEQIGKHVVESALEVHRELGPGLLESVYEICLSEEPKNRKLFVERQVSLPVCYKGKQLDKVFVIDLLVEDSVIIELKACETLLPVHEVQLVTYLRLANLHLGYLINFNVSLLKSGIKRKINGFL